MVRSHFVIGASLLLAAAAVCALAFANSQGAKPSTGEAAAASSEAPDPSASDQIEVARLRAELRQKDAIIRAMAASREQAVEAPAVREPPAPTTDAEDPTATACDTLDERLMTAPSDGRRTAEMERAVDTMLDAKALGHSKVSSRYCGGTMCKLVLVGESAEALSASIVAVNERKPKLFAGSIVHSTGPNQSAFYLATNQDDLNVGPPPEIHPPPSPGSDAQRAALLAK